MNSSLIILLKKYFRYDSLRAIVDLVGCQQKEEGMIKTANELKASWCIVNREKNTRIA